MNTPTPVRWLLAATLFTLPWVGVGVGRLATGRDLGFGLQPAWVLLGAAVVLALVGRRKLPNTHVPRSWIVLGAAAMAALILSALGLVIAPVQEGTAVVVGRYLRQVVQLLLMAAFLVAPAMWVRGTDRWRFTARWLVAGAGFQVLYAGLQYLQWHHPGPLLPLLEQVFTSNPAILSGSEQLHVGDGFRDMPRLRGTMCEPLYLGNYLLAVLPLVPLAGWSRRVTCGLILALVTVLLLTWSRGAWVAGVVAGVLAAVLALAGGRRRPGWTLLAGTAVAVAVLAVALGPERLLLPWERLAQSLSTRDWSNLTRLYSVQAAWRAFLLSPVVGVGWGQFAWHFPVLVDPMGLQSQFTWPVVNSFPLRVLCETGLIGFAVLAGAAAGLVRGVVRKLRNPEAGPEQNRRVGACAVAVVGVWTQFAIFSQYNLPHIWLVVGLLLAALHDGPEEAA